MKKLSYCLLFAAAVIMASCNNEDDNSTPSGLIYSYFTTNVGHEIIYDASLITKDEFSGESDTSYYQIKEVIESIFLDNQGRITQRLERYRRDTPNDAWVISDVWTSNLTGTRAEKKEDNVTFVKMVFPISSTVTWNGNSLNTLEPQDYEYENLHQADNVGGLNFDSTLTVLQMDFDDPFTTLYQVEKYAPGVGMIYKEDIFIDKAFPLAGIISQRLYKETIVSWTN